MERRYDTKMTWKGEAGVTNTEKKILVKYEKSFSQLGKLEYYLNNWLSHL